MPKTHYEEAREFRNKSISAFFGWYEKIVAIATTTLALSVTFREKLAGSNPKYLWLLNVTWVALALCIISGVFVQKAQAVLFQSAADLFDAKTDQEIDRVAPPSIPLLNFWKSSTLWSFLTAIAALTAFAVFNNL